MLNENIIPAEDIVSGVRFFRIMKPLEESWKPYRMVPIYDDHPELGSYESTIHLPVPLVGDYLVIPPKDEPFVERPGDSEAFDDVYFHAIPPVSDLIQKGIVVEVPDPIRKADYKLQDKLFELSEDIRVLEDYLGELSYRAEKRRFGFLTKDARHARELYLNASKDLEDLYAESTSLNAEHQKTVLKPLEALVKENSARVGLDKKIADASGQCKPEPEGRSMGQAPER